MQYAWNTGIYMLNIQGIQLSIQHGKNGLKMPKKPKMQQFDPINWPGVQELVLGPVLLFHLFRFNLGKIREIHVLFFRIFNIPFFL